MNLLKEHSLNVKTALSNLAIKDLRIALQKSYGSDFGNDLNDEEINNIGVFVLTGLVESLKLEIIHPELFTKNA